MFINNTRPCINEIQILKYKIGGHYKFHTDLGPSNARSISLIFFVTLNKIVLSAYEQTHLMQL